MSRAIPYSKILNASLEGVNNAFNKHHKWCNGDWLEWAPECFIQVEIANSLSKIFPSINLEAGVKYILQESNAELRGRKPRNSNSGRIDIVVNWADHKPRFLVEVKKAYNYNDLTKDARRLKKLLNRGGSLQGGMLIAYTSAGNPRTIDKRFNNMVEKSGSKLKSRLGPIRRNDDGEIWYWDAGCFSVVSNPG